MSKKTVYAILITFGALILALAIVLGVLVVAFFGLGNGLVAELWGDRDVQHVTADPPDEYFETQDETHDVRPIETMPPAQTQTQNPEVMQGTPDEMLHLTGEDIEDWNMVKGAFKRTFAHNDLQAVDGTLTEDDGFVMCVATDAEYVYFAFEVNDRTVMDSQRMSYSGDHFIISLDLGALCQAGWEYPAPVTYSFGKHPTGSIDVAAKTQSAQNGGEEQYFSSYPNGDKSVGRARGGVRVRTAIEGPNIVKVAWGAEFALTWDVLIEQLEQNHGMKLAELGLEREKLYAVMEVSYVDMDNEGNFVKSYSISEPLTLILYPDEMNVITLN